jgi:type I restriction enzyme M protein
VSFEEFAGCLAWWNQREENAQAWKVSVQEVLRYDEKGNVVAANLDIKNPQAQVDLEPLSPVPLVVEVMEKERRILEIWGEIKLALGEK